MVKRSSAGDGSLLGPAPWRAPAAIAAETTGTARPVDHAWSARRGQSRADMNGRRSVTRRSVDRPDLGFLSREWTL